MNPNAVVSEITNYLKTEYCIRSIEIQNGGKHRRLCFDYNGRTVKLTVNDRNEKGFGGSGVIALKKQDIRRILGEPPKIQQETKRSSLSELTDELEESAKTLKLDMPPVETMVTLSNKPETLSAVVALYESNGSLTFKLPDSLVSDFYKGINANLRGCKVDFTKPDLWSIRHNNAERPAIKATNYSYQQLRVGAADVMQIIGAFKGTAARAWMDGGVIRVKLDEAPNKYGEPVRKIEPVEKQSWEILEERLAEIAAIPDEQIDTSDIPEAADSFFEKAVLRTPETVQAAPTLLEDRLRDVLSEIRDLHANSPYRLFNIGGEWIWRAVIEIK